MVFDQRPSQKVLYPIMAFRQQVISGISWVTFSNIGKQVLRFGFTVILARLLLPEEFGLVAMITVFITFAELFTDMGFTGALLQKQDITEDHRSSVFWLNVLAGLILTLLFAAAAPLIASFYGEAILIPMVVLTSLIFFIGAFNDVQTALIRREMNFRRLTLITLASIAAGGVGAIIFALLGFGVWSLVFKSLIEIIVEVVIMWVVTDWKPRLIFKWGAVRELMGFSVNLLGFQTVNYWSRNLDNVLIGRFIDPVNLGLYRQAFGTMVLPMTQITRTLHVVMFPALSRIQGETERVKRIVLRAHRVISLILMPTLVGLAITAEPFVLTVYGEKWAGMTVILQILCLSSLTHPITVALGWVYQSQGRTDLQFRWSLFTGLVTLAAFLVGVRWGVIGVAAAYAVPNYLLWYPAVTIPGRLIGLTFRECLQNIAQVSLFTGIMGVAVWLVGQALPAGLTPLPVLLIQVTTGVIVYAALIIGFKVQAYQDIRALIERKRG